MTLEAVPLSLRGELSRWLMEVQPGVYVGNATALVRDLLWDKAVQNVRTGRGTQIYRANNAQGVAVRMYGDPHRTLVSLDGFQLVAVRNARHIELQGEYNPPEDDDKL